MIRQGKIENVNDGVSMLDITKVDKSRQFGRVSTDFLWAL